MEWLQSLSMNNSLSDDNKFSSEDLERHSLERIVPRRKKIGQWESGKAELEMDCKKPIREVETVCTDNITTQWELCVLSIV